MKILFREGLESSWSDWREVNPVDDLIPRLLDRVTPGSVLRITRRDGYMAEWKVKS